MKIDPRHFVALPMTRKPCAIGGEIAPDHYSIHCAGRDLGRIRLASNGEWYWSITGSSALDTGHGRDPSYEEARDAFKAAFDRWLTEEVAWWEAHGARNNWHPDGPVWNKDVV